jgi:hypothetical protein
MTAALLTIPYGMEHYFIECDVSHNSRGNLEEDFDCNGKFARERHLLASPCLASL